MADRISEQTILEKVYDPTYKSLSVQGYGYDGVQLQRLVGDAMAEKTTIVGSIIYEAIAAPGTAQSTAKWQCKKTDTSSGVVTTWADGNANFDNVATNLTSLSYS